MADDLQHSFLLGMPSLTGTYFGESLIYVCEHNADGAMGLIVNKLSSVTFQALADDLGLPRAGHQIDILEGGPVSPEQGFVLHTTDRTYASSRELAPGISLSSSPDALEALATLDGPAHSLVLLGYAGWGPGQLESEIEDDAWLTCNASRTVLFHTSIATRRQAAAATIGVDMRLMARHTGHA